MSTDNLSKLAADCPCVSNHCYSDHSFSGCHFIKALLEIILTKMEKVIVNCLISLFGHVGVKRDHNYNVIIFFMENWVS